jgi:hypothetical protein
MSKDSLKNLQLRCWRHEDKLGKVTPSLCLFHDAINVGQQLLRALNELQASPLP